MVHFSFVHVFFFSHDKFLPYGSFKLWCDVVWLIDWLVCWIESLPIDSLSGIGLFAAVSDWFDSLLCRLGWFVVAVLYWFVIVLDCLTDWFSSVPDWITGVSDWLASVPDWITHALELFTSISESLAYQLRLISLVMQVNFPLSF